ncbi:MAG TPA: NAD(P)/FAD-dependent oxidoreductase, partial [Actinomycetota bacterium]|nr:NAD(P)/FAD-dependent oxidoreductase [Actinomycetota bacterium]
PGFVHDTCSTVWSLGLASKALRTLPLEDHGVTWVQPDLPLAQPLDGGRAALLHRSVDETAAGLGADAEAYRRLMGPLVAAGFDLVDGLLSPFDLPPRHPVTLARYGLPGIRSAHGLGHGRFDTEEAQALLGGLSAHSILSLKAPITAGYGLMLGVVAHLVGYPVARGGSQRVTDALVRIIEGQGGAVEVGHRVGSLAEVPPAKAVLLDVSARSAAAIGGDRFPPRYHRALSRFRYGSGVHKVDWALDGPVPWADPEVARAGTVHLGGTLDELVAAEGEVAAGRHPEQPFVLLVQASGFDPTRAPEGHHALWAYCHVPNGSTVDMTERIEAQVERFAPGFRDRVLGRHVMGTAEVAARNANFVGGDINAGAADFRQFVRRPTLGLDPWRTPAKGVYLCSSSTPPGGGVHGMCGWHAARSALKHEF